MKETPETTPRVEKRIVKRRRHNHHHGRRHKSDTYSKSANSWRMQTHDKVEAGFTVLLIKVLIFIGAIGLLLWALLKSLG